MDFCCLMPFQLERPERITHMPSKIMSESHALHISSFQSTGMEAFGPVGNQELWTLQSVAMTCDAANVRKISSSRDNDKMDEFYNVCASLGNLGESQDSISPWERIREAIRSNPLVSLTRDVCMNATRVRHLENLGSK